MKLTNIDIYEMANKLNNAFIDNKIYLPAKINFYLQKNKSIILKLAEEIENARKGVFYQYGVENNGMITIPEDKQEIAQKELSDLFLIEQEVNIHTFSIDNFSNDINLSMEQMEAIMFMIEEA